MDDSHKRRKQDDSVSTGPRTTGSGTRPPLAPFYTFETRFLQGNITDSFRSKKHHDANQQRFVSEIHAIREKYNAAENDGQRAGLVNEARQVHAMKRKYKRMTPEEKSVRQYFPQPAIASDWKPSHVRYPDMLKVKTEADGRQVGSFTEFKSASYTKDQRDGTFQILQAGRDLSVVTTKGARPRKLDAVKSYKTVFTKEPPEDPSAQFLNPSNNGSDKSTLKGTGIQVYSRKAETASPRIVSVPSNFGSLPSGRSATLQSPPSGYPPSFATPSRGFSYSVSPLPVTAPVRASLATSSNDSTLTASSPQFSLPVRRQNKFVYPKPTPPRQATPRPRSPSPPPEETRPEPPRNPKLFAAFKPPAQAKKRAGGDLEAPVRKPPPPSDPRHGGS